MGNFILITDSSCDFNKELLEEIDVKIIPYTFCLKDVEYIHDIEQSQISTQQFYKELRNGAMATSSQHNPERFIEYFTPFLEKGFDILNVSFSGGMSGSYNSSLIAIESLKEKYPNQTIVSIDSLCATMGEALFVYDLALLKKAGKSMEEIIHYAEENKLKYCHIFTVDDLHFLKRGGRLSASAAVIGTLIKLKPVLQVNDEGKLMPVGKVVGRKNSLKFMVNRMIETADNLNNQVVFIAHGDCKEDLDYIVDLIQTKAKPKRIVTNLIGPPVGAHSGPGAITIFYKGFKR